MAGHGTRGRASVGQHAPVPAQPEHGNGRRAGQVERDRTEWGPAIPYTMPRPDVDVVAAPAIERHRATGPRRRSTRSIVLGAVGALAALSLIAGGVLVHLDTRSRLDRTTSELRARTADLDRTTSELQSSRADLETIRSVLDNANQDRSAAQARNQDLTDRNRELNDTIGDLRTRISGLEGSLAQDEARLQEQAVEIENLQTCLDGFVLALSDLGTGDFAGAANALAAIDPSCQSVGVDIWALFE